MKKTWTLLFILLLACTPQKKEEKPPVVSEKKKEETAPRQCLYEFDPQKTYVKWQAFKLENRVPVTGFFKKFEVHGKKKGINIEDIFGGANFTIDTRSTETNNEVRNKKIVEHFFAQMLETTNIIGKFSNLQSESKKVDLELTLNGNKGVITLPYTITGNTLTLKGLLSRELFAQFKMEKSLQALHEACKVHHGEKIWSEFNIFLESTFKKTCE